jgi:hypothetical protein
MKIDGTMSVITFGEDKDAVGWKDQRYAVRSGSSYSPYKRKMYTGENMSSCIRRTESVRAQALPHRSHIVREIAE